MTDSPNSSVPNFLAFTQWWIENRDQLPVDCVTTMYFPLYTAFMAGAKAGYRLAIQNAITELLRIQADPNLLSPTTGKEDE